MSIINRMQTLATLFTAILADLRSTIGAAAGRTPARAPLCTLVWAYLARAARRFDRLYTQWRAGTLPAPGPARPGRPVTPRTTPRLPAGYAWIIGLAGHQAANLGSQLTHLLARPDAADFLREVPRAARMLRPLCHALAQPEPIPRPPRPRPPRPRPARPPKPPAPPSDPPRHGKYTPSQIRRYRPGRIPDFILKPT